MFVRIMARPCKEDAMGNSGIKTSSLPNILATLKELKAEVKQKYKAELKGVFGSYARGEEVSGSDLDVLVEFDATANLIDLVGLSFYLEEKLHCFVDVVPQSALREELRSAILQEAVAV
jgi:predicted nucleotidyltransferase